MNSMQSCEDLRLLKLLVPGAVASGPLSLRVRALLSLIRRRGTATEAQLATLRHLLAVSAGNAADYDAVAHRKMDGEPSYKSADGEVASLCAFYGAATA